MSEIKTVYNPDVDERYEGGLVNDQFHGKGTFFFANGNKYVGDWVNNKRQGYGVMYFADGDRYEGQFMNDKMNGKGVYIFKAGIKKVGTFRNDKFVGSFVPPKGTHLNGSGKISPNFFSTGRTLTITGSPTNEDKVYLRGNNVEGFETLSIGSIANTNKDSLALNAFNSRSSSIASKNLKTTGSSKNRLLDEMCEETVENLRKLEKNRHASTSVTSKTSDIKNKLSKNASQDDMCEETVENLRKLEKNRRTSSVPEHSELKSALFSSEADQESLQGFSTLQDKRRCEEIYANKYANKGKIEI